MKKLMMTVASVIAALAFSQAQALEDMDYTNYSENRGSQYLCRLTGEMRGVSIAFGVGGQVISGQGKITCTDLNTGRRLVQPVKLRLAGAGWGLELSRIRSIRVVSSGVTVSNIAYFYDNFSVGAEAGASLINQGIGFDLALRLAGQNGFGFDLAVQGRDILGLGAHLYAMGFRIYPIQ